MKVAFFYSFEQSSWKSCQTITKNLKATYDLFISESNQRSFDYNEKSSSFDLLNSVNAVIDFAPNYIIILDHKPHPYKIIDLLHKNYEERKIKKLPEIIIHIFGDFTLYSEQWKKAEEALKNFSVKFITASDSQKDLVGKFLKNKKSGLYKCPFPVDTDDFYFDQALRNIYRKKMELTDNQTLFVYTGRMSLQKKVLDLMVDFSTYLKTSNADAYLYLAGEFDDLGNPFAGIYSKEGLFYLNFRSLYEKLDANAKNRIRYVGNLTTNELKALYSSADVFISLSVHNDEDYGMSPAEAQCTGLPCILTEWAGYRSFKREKDNQCYLIKTIIEDNKITYNRSQLLKSFFIVKKNELLNRQNRLELQKINAEYLSIKSNKVVLNEILKDKPLKFLGFSPLLDMLTSAFKMHPPFITTTATTITVSNSSPKVSNPRVTTKLEHSYSDLYKKIYDSYISK